MSTPASLIALALAASQPGPSLEDLAGVDAFPATVDGTPMTDHPSQKPCVYFEWGWGEKKRGRFVEHFRGQQSDRPVVVHTPKGDVELPVHALRTHLAPSYSKAFKPGDAKRAPPVLRPQLQLGQTVTLEEHCLVPGKRYWARVRVDTMHLPPDEGGAPAERRHAVLLLSDAPFKGGEPARPLTPGYTGWTY